MIFLFKRFCFGWFSCDFFFFRVVWSVLRVLFSVLGCLFRFLLGRKEPWLVAQEGKLCALPCGFEILFMGKKMKN